MRKENLIGKIFGIALACLLIGLTIASFPGANIAASLVSPSPTAISTGFTSGHGPLNSILQTDSVRLVETTNSVFACPSSENGRLTNGDGNNTDAFGAPTINISGMLTDLDQNCFQSQSPNASDEIVGEPKFLGMPPPPKNGLSASDNPLWYAGTIYPSSAPSQTATSIEMSITAPSTQPNSANFFYVALSTCDTASSYDQIGIVANYGTWYAFYSWTTGPLNSPTYHFDARWYPLSTNGNYYFIMRITNGGISFYLNKYSAGTWSTVASFSTRNGATAMYLQTSFNGYACYTEYEEVWDMHNPSGVPEDNFVFKRNVVLVSGVGYYQNAWDRLNIGAPDSAVIQKSFADVIIDNSATHLFVPYVNPISVSYPTSASVGQPITIQFSAEARAGYTATEMDIEASFPLLTAADQVTVISSPPSGSVYGSGATVWGSYGYLEYLRSYILVDYYAVNVPDGTSLNLALQVTPQTPGTFTFYLASVLGLDFGNPFGWAWMHWPDGFQSNYAQFAVEVDERNEYVCVCSIDIKAPTYPPTVTTDGATSVEETTVTLNGMINTDGGEACQYRFEYDTDPGEPYAHNTAWTGSKITGDLFSAAPSSLSKGTKYYFRAQAKNSAGSASGSELTFLTKPDAPSSFDASTASSTQINLSWTKGAGAQKTRVQRKEGSYPTNRDDGTTVYFDTGTSKPDTGLKPDTTYYYCAWAYVQGSEQWSDSYSQASATTQSVSNTEVSISPPSQEVKCGDSFLVNVAVDPKVAIVGMQCNLSFNSSLVKANGVTEGNLLKQGGAPTFFMPGAINNTAGNITAVFCFIIPPDASVSQPGTFATINFTATAVGTSVLHLSNVIVASPQAVSITVSDGSVTITNAVTVSIVAPDEVAEESDFTANVTVDYVEDFDSCGFDVTYDKTIINVTAVTGGEIDGHTVTVGPGDWTYIPPGPDPGRIRVSAGTAGMPAPGVNGTGYIAQIHYHVLGSHGQTSPIHLEGVGMYDYQAKKIPTTTQDDTITVTTSCKPGDANMDGVVDTGDITKVKRIYFGIDTPTPCADVNGDGVIDTGDITAIKVIYFGT
jgi:hypothetical protein